MTLLHTPHSTIKGDDVSPPAKPHGPAPAIPFPVARQPCETAVYEARRAKVAPHGGDVVWDAVVHEVGEVRL